MRCEVGNQFEGGGTGRLEAFDGTLVSQGCDFNRFFVAVRPTGRFDCSTSTNNFVDCDVEIMEDGVFAVANGAGCTVNNPGVDPLVIKVDGLFAINGTASATRLTTTGSVILDGIGELLFNGARTDWLGDDVENNVRVTVIDGDIEVDEFTNNEKVEGAGGCKIDGIHWTNNGAIRGTAGTTTLLGTDFDNTNGEILALGDGMLVFGLDANVVGGIIGSAGGTALLGAGSSFEDVTVTGSGTQLVGGANVAFVDALTFEDGANVGIPGGSTTTTMTLNTDPGGIFLIVAEPGGEGTVAFNGPFANMKSADPNQEVEIDEGVYFDVNGGARIGGHTMVWTFRERSGIRVFSGLCRFQPAPGSTTVLEGKWRVPGGSLRGDALDLRMTPTGGLIADTDGSSIEIFDSTIMGGNMSGTGGGGIEVTRSTMQGEDAANPLNVEGDLILGGGNTFGEDVVFNGASVSTTPGAGGTVDIGTIAGVIFLTMNNLTDVLRPPPAATTGIVVPVNSSVSGQGTVENLEMNEGTVATKAAGTLTLEPAAASLPNAGRLFADLASLLLVSGGVNNTGTLDVGQGGEIRGTGALVTSGSTVMSGAGRLNFTSVTATGTSSMSMNGQIAALTTSLDGAAFIGFSPGEVEFTGNVTLEPGLALEIEIGGNGAAGVDFDHLQVMGDLELGGTLKPRLINGYIPGPGESFAVIECDGEMTGTFATIDQPFGSLGTFNVSYDEVNDRVLLTFSTTGPGSFADFQRLWFSDAEIAAGDAEMEADIDEDGLGTYLEWLFGLSPVRPDAGEGALGIELAGGGVDLRFRRSTELPPGVVMEVETSDDGTAWPDVPVGDYTVLPGVPIPGEAAETVVVRITDPDLANDARRLFRLGFTGP